jgi:hypothetical protein
MSTADNYILKDEDVALSRDEASLVSAAQGESSDLDELYSYLTESSPSASGESEAETSMVDEMPFSEELGDVSDGVSVLQELEAMYGSSDESVTDEREASVAIESLVENIYDDASAGDSVLKELEALLGSSVQSVTDSVATESQRSVLDELQSLIQSSIDELKATANGNIGLSLSSTEWAYPTRDELRDLLESKLLQLIVDSDIPLSSDPADGASVLDELSSLLGETANEPDALTTYISSPEEDVLPETEDSETPEQADESILSAEPVAEGFENLLSGLTEAEAPEVLQDDLTISDHDEAAVKTDAASVMDELEAYFDVSSDHENSEFQKIDTGYSAEEEKEADSISASPGSTSSALEQLETMLSETAGSGDDETSENIKPVDDDLIFQQESSPLSAANKVDKDKDTRKLRDTVGPVEAKKDSQIQAPSVEGAGFSAEQENNKRLPKSGMLFVVVAVIGVITMWNLSDEKEGLNDNLQISQSQFAEESVAVKTGSETLVRTKAEPVSPAEIDNIDDLLASIESTDYEKKSFYEDESNDSFEKPVQSNADEALDDRAIISKAEIDESQMESPEDSNETEDNRAIESISQQVEYLQDKNEKSMGSLEESVDLLSERMIEAESSISRLQHALEKSEQSAPVQTVVSTVNDGVQVNQKHDENEKNIGLLNKRVIDAESTISKMQHTIEQAEQFKPVQSVTSIASEMNATHQTKDEVSKLNDQSYNIWSVHLFSFYGKPPPASELEFLDIAGVPYQIERAIVNDGVWYRVLVNNSAEYRVAKQYAKMLKKRLAIKKIWISKKQYVYD